LLFLELLPAGAQRLLVRSLESARGGVSLLPAYVFHCGNLSRPELPGVLVPCADAGHEVAARGDSATSGRAPAEQTPAVAGGHPSSLMCGLVGIFGASAARTDNGAF